MLAKVAQEVLGLVEALGADLAAVRTINGLGGQGTNFLEVTMTSLLIRVIQLLFFHVCLRFNSLPFSHIFRTILLLSNVCGGVCEGSASVGCLLVPL